MTSAPGCQEQTDDLQRESVRVPDVPEFVVGGVVHMRKAHPCGADTWTVTRVGGDVGLLCSGCGRRIFVPRRQLARSLRSSQSRAKLGCGK